MPALDPHSVRVEVIAEALADVIYGQDWSRLSDAHRHELRGKAVKILEAVGRSSAAIAAVDAHTKVVTLNGGRH
jgi:hypothetical protein